MPTLMELVAMMEQGLVEVITDGDSVIVVIVDVSLDSDDDLRELFSQLPA